MRRLNSILLVLLYIQLGIGQTDLAIGEWGIHIPFKYGLSVTQSPDYIYYATDLAIWRIHKLDRNYDYITKIDGLSQAEPSIIKYHPGQRALFVAYESGIIDILETTGVSTMKDISNFSNFPIDRTPNHVFVDGQNTLVLSSNFGMSRVDIKNKKILWTTFTLDLKVNAVSKLNGMYYCATTDGLYRIEEDGQVENFAAWERLDDSHGLGDTEQFGAMTLWRDQLWVGGEASVFRYNDTLNVFNEIHRQEDYEVSAMSGEHRRLFATYQCLDNCPPVVVDFDFRLDTATSDPNCIGMTLDAIEDERGFVWYADRYNLFRMAPGNGTPCQYFDPNSPSSSNVHEIAIGENNVVVATGGTINGFAYAFRNDGFFILDDYGNWYRKSLFNDVELKTRDLKNFHRVRIHPQTGDQYHGTYWGGIVVFHKDGSYTFYDESNSALREKDPSDARERVIGMEFDQDHNLWVASFLAPENSLAVLRNDGSWKGFDPPNFGESPNEVAVDSNGFKWVTMTADAARGVYVFDEGDMDNDLDDRGYVFSQNNSQLPSNNVISVAVDLDGDVWVGTDQGAVVFECGDDYFEGNCVGNRRKVEQDSIIAYLLETEEIRSIAIDGANRKWFGTRNGIYVQSASGEDQVMAFNTDNSPLLSNVINDIAIDQRNGMVYIGTEKGINVYRTDATAGGKNHANEVFAFPNPVRPGYDGPIAIKGLPRDANVKITDVSGTLVYETTAFGGQAVWDGRDYNGEKARSGVYLVFSTSEGGSFEKPEALVTKFMIMN